MCWRNIPRITCVCLFVFFSFSLPFFVLEKRGRGVGAGGFAETTLPLLSFSLFAVFFFRTMALLNAGEFDIRASSLGRSKLLSSSSSSSSDRFKNRSRVLWKGPDFLVFASHVPREPLSNGLIPNLFSLSVVLSFILSLSLSSTRNKSHATSLTCYVSRSHQNRSKTIRKPNS